jgi:hypothetical protein
VWERDFCFFSCSQCVPIMFPWGFKGFLEFSSCSSRCSQ